LLYRLQTIFLSACLMAAMLALSCNEAAAGETFIPPVQIPPPAPQAPPPNPAFGANSASASSWLVGAHAGYNWQRGAAVFGFETDLQATHLNSSMFGGLSYNPPIVPPPAGDFAATTALIDWYGTFRGRLGVTAGQWLFYGTAGLAYGGVSLSSNFSTAGLSLASQVSDTKVGWVAGVGAEYLLRPNVVLNIGYQYVDLGTLNLAASTPPGVVVIGQRASASAQFQAVMAGVSWRFAPMGAPWEGGYVGAHGGGAWGNSTDAAYTSSVFLPSDIRLKRDVALVARRSDGLGIYRYKYLWSDDVYVGVVAQEVALIRPDAVARDPLHGYLSVDYGRLGLQPVAVR
jgi:outer membrane immunogenic protein